MRPVPELAERGANLRPLHFRNCPGQFRSLVARLQASRLARPGVVSCCTTCWSTQSPDLAIIGSGFGGSLLSMIARRLGYRVTLLERGKHPAFRDWRIGVAARGHSDRTACGSIRPSTRAAALCVWHMAAHLPPRRMRTQARVHVTSSTNRAPAQSGRGADEPVARGGKPERRALRHALAAKRRRSVSGQRSDSPPGELQILVTSVDLACAYRIRTHRDAALLTGNRDGVRAVRFAPVWSLMQAARRIHQPRVQHRQSRLRRLPADAGIFIPLHRCA